MRHGVPTCAIELRNPTDAELTAQLKHSIVATKGHPVIVCEQALEAANVAADDASAACAVPCLGRMDEVGARGVGGVPRLRRDAGLRFVRDVPTCSGRRSCARWWRARATCPRRSDPPCPSTWRNACPERVLEPGGSHGQAGSDGVGRRDFFRSAKDASTRAAGAAVAEGVGDGRGRARSCGVSQSGRRWDAVAVRPPRAACGCTTTCSVGQPTADEVETRVIGAVSIDAQKCSSCRMCAVFCPTAPSRTRRGRRVRHRAPSERLHAVPPVRAHLSRAGHRGERRVPIKQFMGKEAVCFAMKRPTWTPNKPSSMYDKLHATLGEHLEMCMF